MILSFALFGTWFRARFGNHERGASLVEYAFLVGLIALVCFAALTFFGTAMSSRYDNVGSSVAN